jgi:hypothetical protein
MTRTDLPDNGHHHRTPVQYFSMIMGGIFLLVGVLGFIPGANVMHQHMHHDLHVTHSQGNLLGLFPVNVLHNLVHIAFGVWGLASFSRFGAARVFARGTAIIYAVLAVMGFIPGLNTMFGLVPIYGNDIWLHGLIALASAVFGFAPRPAHDTGIGHGHTPHHV